MQRARHGAGGPRFRCRVDWEQGSHSGLFLCGVQSDGSCVCAAAYQLPFCSSCTVPNYYAYPACTCEHLSAGLLRFPARPDDPSFVSRRLQPVDDLQQSRRVQQHGYAFFAPWPHLACSDPADSCCRRPVRVLDGLCAAQLRLVCHGEDHTLILTCLRLFDSPGFDSGLLFPELLRVPGLQLLPGRDHVQRARHLQCRVRLSSCLAPAFLLCAS